MNLCSFCSFYASDLAPPTLHLRPLLPPLRRLHRRRSIHALLQRERRRMSISWLGRRSPTIPILSRFNPDSGTLILPHISSIRTRHRRIHRRSTTLLTFEPSTAPTHIWDWSWMPDLLRFLSWTSLQETEAESSYNEGQAPNRNSSNRAWRKYHFLCGIADSRRARTAAPTRRCGCGGWPSYRCYDSRHSSSGQGACFGQCGCRRCSATTPDHSSRNSSTAILCRRGGDERRSNALIGRFADTSMARDG